MFEAGKAGCYELVRPLLSRPIPARSTSYSNPRGKVSSFQKVWPSKRLQGEVMRRCWGATGLAGIEEEASWRECAPAGMAGLTNL